MGKKIKGGHTCIALARSVPKIYRIGYHQVTNIPHRQKDEIGMTRVNKWNFLIDAIAKKRTVVHYAA